VGRALELARKWYFIIGHVTTHAREFGLILNISSADQKVTIEIAIVGGEKKIRLGETEISCDWVKLAEGHYSLILDGRVFDILVNLDTDTCVVMSHAGTYTFRISNQRRSGSETLAHEVHAGLKRICADMPGKVIRVLVQEGDNVVYDQGLLVLEAMKMQNEIRAPKSGIIKEVATVAGKTVNTGDFLLSIE
jgi:biotin carboxyl carrier protein